MKNFNEEYTNAFRDMVKFHVREGAEKRFLEAVYYSTNQNSSSAVWGAVLDVAEELFGKEYVEFLVRSKKQLKEGVTNTCENPQIVEARLVMKDPYSNTKTKSRTMGVSVNG